MGSFFRRGSPSKGWLLFYKTVASWEWCFFIIRRTLSWGRGFYIKCEVDFSIKRRAPFQGANINIKRRVPLLERGFSIKRRVSFQEGLINIKRLIFSQEECFSIKPRVPSCALVPSIPPCSHHGRPCGAVSGPVSNRPRLQVVTLVHYSGGSVGVGCGVYTTQVAESSSLGVAAGARAPTSAAASTSTLTTSTLTTLLLVVLRLHSYY